MSQVLDTPEIRDKEAFIAVDKSPVPSPERAESVTEKPHQLIPFLRSILSVFTASKPEYLPKEYGLVGERYDTPIDHLCRIDPSLCMRTLSV
jgi:hypothetical protein